MRGCESIYSKNDRMGLRFQESSHRYDYFRRVRMVIPGAELEEEVSGSASVLEQS